MTQTIEPCTYYAEGGPANTDAALELMRAYCQAHPVEHIIIASTSGTSALRAMQVLDPAKLIVVSYGFAKPNHQELLPEARQQLVVAGIPIVTAAHAFGGVNRAVRTKFGPTQLDELIANTLRLVSDGFKVACEITLMAADAGLVASGEEVLAAGGTGRGIDTAALLRAAVSQNMFDLRVLELVCKPRTSQRP